MISSLLIQEPMRKILVPTKHINKGKSKLVIGKQLKERGAPLLPLQVAVVRLPPPILVAQIRPAMLVTSQLVRHVWAVRFLVQRIGIIIKHPFAWEHVTALQSLSPVTVPRLTVSPRNFPTTVLFGGVACTESIQNLWNSQKNQLQPTSPNQRKTTNLTDPVNKLIKN